MSKAPFPDMDELLQRLLDDQIAPDEMARLGKAIREDARVRDYYIDSLLVSAVIRRSSQVTGELSASDLIQALSIGENLGRSKRLARSLYSIAAVLVLGILIFTAVILFRPTTQGPEIGTLVGAYEAQWRGACPRPGEPVHVGAYDLREGVAKMTLNGGTNLLLEAPCQVKLTSVEEVTLKNGRLVVGVSLPARGLRVRTHTALITDLGTEFGVIARSDGSTEAHVLKGRVNVALDPDGSGRSSSLVVTEGQAATVDATGSAIQDGLAARPDYFVLQLPPSSQFAGQVKRLNLADIVGGGSGHGTGTLDQGIDLGTARAFKGAATTIRRARENEFRATPQFNGIDGVFVPNGALGPVVISSTGLTFSECPRTTGSYFGGPANSGTIFDLPSQLNHTARLNGVRFGNSKHPALNLHPNAGITFDLNQIRRDNADTSIERFTAVCGIPKDLPQSQFSTADVWVLLDGVVRLHLRFPKEQSRVEQIDVPIPAESRFLTLVATCSGRADYSWIFFGDPYLE